MPAAAAALVIEFCGWLLAQPQPQTRYLHLEVPAMNVPCQPAPPPLPPLPEGPGSTQTHQDPGGTV